MLTRFIATLPPAFTHFSMPLKFGEVLVMSPLEQVQIFLRQAPSNFIAASSQEKASLIGLVFLGAWIIMQAYASKSNSDFNAIKTIMLSENSFDEFFGLRDVSGDGSCFYHAIVGQLKGKTVVNLRNRTANAISTAFSHYLEDGKVINGGEEKDSPEVVQLRVEMQTNGLVKEGEIITKDKFDEYLVNVRSTSSDFSGWGSDFQAKYLAESLKVKIHIVRSTEPSVVLSWILSIFFNVQKQSVRDSYVRTMHGDRGKDITIFHCGGNHYQILEIKHDGNIDLIPHGA